MNFYFFILIFLILVLLFFFTITSLGGFIFAKFFKFKSQNSRKKNIYITTILSVLFILFEIFYNPAKNFKTAYIEKTNDKYIITVIGKRNLMVHDPISALKKGTYIDSAKFTIPKAYGIIKGMEMPNEPDSYKTINNHALIIDDKTITINLFYDNYDDKVNQPSVWNGKYKLVKRNF